MTADCITLSRVLFSLLLLVFSPQALPFSVFYWLCGATDVLDGFVARRLHTESEKGAMLDSAADLIFAVVYAVRILPTLSLPLWLRGWAACIAAAKLTGILIAGKRVHGLSIEHSFGNRLTGLLLFLLPPLARVMNVRFGAVLVCTVATVTVIKETARWMMKKL